MYQRSCPPFLSCQCEHRLVVLYEQRQYVLIIYVELRHGIVLRTAVRLVEPISRRALPARHLYLLLEKVHKFDRLLGWTHLLQYRLVG